MPRLSEIKLSNPIEKHFSVISLYHYYFFFILFLSKIPVFWHFMSLIFLSPPIDYICNSTNIINTNISSRNYCPCENPTWDRNIFTETVQSKFDLHCERRWLVSFTQSTLYIGTLIGALLFGVLSDKLGRRFACSLSLLLLGASGCMLSAMPNVTAFIIMRCIEGISAGGYIVAGFVFIVEHCGLNNREVVTALYHIPINLSHISLAGVSYLLRDCDRFQMAISVPVLAFVLIRCLTMESPKWLMDQGRIDKAVKVMERILKFNKKPHDSIQSEIKDYIGKRPPTKEHMNLTEIFKHRRLSTNLACMSAIYFVCGMGFYGVSQYIGQMSGDIHKNVAISGILLLPGTIAATFLLKILDRRILLMITNFLSGIFMIIVISIPTHMSLVRVIVACICNCFFFMSFITAFLYGVELFPTAVRSSALGFLSLMSRLGQIVAPPLNALPEFISGLIFGIMAIVGAVLCYPLPETKNIELPSSLEDTKSIRKSSRDKSEKGGTTKSNEPEISTNKPSSSK